jgi:hypothetical protein
MKVHSLHIYLYINTQRYKTQNWVKEKLSDTYIYIHTHTHTYIHKHLCFLHITYLQYINTLWMLRTLHTRLHKNNDLLSKNVTVLPHSVTVLPNCGSLNSYWYIRCIWGLSRKQYRTINMCVYINLSQLRKNVGGRKVGLHGHCFHVSFCQTNIYFFVVYMICIFEMYIHHTFHIRNCESLCQCSGVWCWIKDDRWEEGNRHTKRSSKTEITSCTFLLMYFQSYRAGVITIIFR